jgi:hypothetical protein
MMKRLSMVSALAMALFLPFGVALLADHASALEMTDAPENIYGNQLMTQDERLDHRARMSAAKTAAEREHIRQEHHARMKARARERGVTLPDEPPARASGMGGGSGLVPGDGGTGLSGGLGR